MEKQIIKFVDKGQLISKCLFGVLNSSKKLTWSLNFCPSLLGQKFFNRFLDKLKEPENPSEINRPLMHITCVWSKANYLCGPTPLNEFSFRIYIFIGTYPFLFLIYACTVGNGFFADAFHMAWFIGSYLPCMNVTKWWEHGRVSLTNIQNHLALFLVWNN